MPKYSKSFVRVEDPHGILALNIFLEAFKDIECYFKGEGTIAERIEGKKSIDWIRKMKGNFKILAIAARPYTIEEFHELCLKKINSIKSNAYAKRRME